MAPPIRPVGFFAALALSCALVLTGHAALVLVTKGLGREFLPYQALLEHQLQKADTTQAEVVFVGDSSLGNAIDAKEWERLSGRSTVNLALTGVYGYEGSHRMLLRVLRHSKPKTVYIMQTADMMRRPLADPSLLDAVAAPDLLSEAAAWWRANMNLTEATESLGFVRRRGMDLFEPAPRKTAISNDYIAQEEQRIIPDDLAGLAPHKVNSNKASELLGIAALCETHGIECAYLHGPLAIPLCSDSTEHYKIVNDLVVATGIPVLTDHSPCVTQEELGDTYDHVGPDHKVDFTRRYFQLVQQVASR
jgi:hypothetical protein